ncbi:MAG: TolC family protein [Cyclobacteriaceae bacterium]|nr:MAG: TolC family protein [Cyclobacteriaceae bacterium]
MKFTVTVLLIVVGVGYGQAQQTLTFKNAINMGLANNLLLNQQKNMLTSTGVNRTSALLQMTPSLSAGGSAGRFDGNSFNQQRGEVVNGQVDFINGGLSASIPIFNGFNQVNAYKQAASQNEAQLNFVMRTKQDVIRNVAFQYLTCLLDQQLLKIDQQNLETQKTQLNQIKQQVDLGGRAEADLYNQEFQVRNAELLVVRSSNRLKNDKALLAQTLMIDPIVSFELEEVNWGAEDYLIEDLTVENLNTTALQSRADLKQASNTERAAQLGYLSRRGRYLPNLSGFAEMNSRYNYIHGALDNRTFDQQFRSDNRQFNYGVSLQVPIFSGFTNRAQVIQQRVTFENARLNTTNMEVRVKSDVLIAYQNYQDARASFSSAEAQLRSGELSYKMEKERYDLGISNIVQLTTAQQSYVRAQSDFASAQFTLMFQKLLINYATGTLQEEDIP